MTSIQANVLLTRNDLLKVNFYMFYKRPIMKVMGVLGVFFLIIGILQNLGFNMSFGEAPMLPLVVGIVLSVALPLTIYIRTRRVYKTTKEFHKPIHYKFTATNFIIIGNNFEDKTKWSNIHKVEETKEWFLVYKTTTMANVITKRSLSATPKTLIDMIGGIKGLKTNF